MNRSVYLDHHATTPLDPRVFEAMRPYFVEEFGNPSSGTHDWGRRAADAVAGARAAVAELLGAKPREIVFTAGATEANNLAIKGAARLRRERGGGTRLATTALEHKAVILAMTDLEPEGFSVDTVAPDAGGRIDAGTLRAALHAETAVISVGSANGEIGVVQDMDALAGVWRDHPAFVHTDATQSVGRLPVDVRAWGVDALSLSAHKFHGPKGVGALYLRDGAEVKPLFSGGGQERGLRSGTLNVPGIVGLGEAARIRRREMDAEAARVSALRDDLWERIRERIPGVVLNGCADHRLPGNLNVCFERVEGESLVLALDGFALSTGSACKSGDDSASEVLLAIGRDPVLARGAVRFGLGPSTTAAHCAALVDSLEPAVARLRSLAPA